MNAVTTLTSAPFLQLNGELPMLVETAADYQTLRGQWHGEKVALVPTMGALHEGHRSLIRQAKSLAARVVVSIFVNPLQFGPNEDFSRYPRTLDTDLEACRAEGVDVVFFPGVDEIYPEGMENATKIIPPDSLTDKLCGLDRPGHFTGVSTVVYQLFQILKPDVAIFGEKDAQQLAIIQQMVKDLRLPVQVSPHPIVREADSLAMSSRNSYLETETDRKLALTLCQALELAKSRLQNSQPDTRELLKACYREVLKTLTQQEQNCVELEYFEALNAQTLMPASFSESLPQEDTRLFIAAKLSLSSGQSVRLIDNLLL